MSISLVPCPLSLVRRQACPSSLAPCPLSLVPCPLSLVPCPLFLVTCPLSLHPCPLSLVPRPLHESFAQSKPTNSFLLDSPIQQNVFDKELWVPGSPSTSSTPPEGRMARRTKDTAGSSREGGLMDTRGTRTRGKGDRRRGTRDKGQGTRGKGQGDRVPRTRGMGQGTEQGRQGTRTKDEG